MGLGLRLRGWIQGWCCIVSHQCTLVFTVYRFHCSFPQLFSGMRSWGECPCTSRKPKSGKLLKSLMIVIWEAVIIKANPQAALGVGKLFDSAFFKSNMGVKSNIFDLTRI